ncbi:MAG: hypothetical protein ACOCUT_01625 [bacterium]
MEINNLYSSYKEVFDIKDEPMEILQNSEIVPFYFNTSNKTSRNSIASGFYKLYDPVRQYSDALNDFLFRSEGFEPEKKGISSLILGNKIIGLYLPFHFYYKPTEPQQEQIWGVWIMEDAIDWFAGHLGEVNCSEEIKKHLARVYTVNFAILFHKLEIFIVTNEIFEKERLYKYHFSVLKNDLVHEINKFAHRYALRKIIDKSAVTRNIDKGTLQELAIEFHKLFIPGDEESFSEPKLLNEIYNRMHQPGRHRKMEIWMDINNWFNTQIRTNSRDNLFLVRRMSF